MDTGVQHSRSAPPVRVLSAVRRHWFLALLPVVAFVGVAVALGLKRPPVYTARSTLTVSRIFVNSPAGVSGVVQAQQTLAGVYARAASSSPVLDGTARRLGRPIPGSMTATQIPDSPLIKITAQAASARDAVAIASAAGDALSAYVQRQTRENRDDSAMLSQYRKAALRYRTLLAISQEAQDRYTRNKSAENKARMDRAYAASDTALVLREALRSSYEVAVQGKSAAAAVEVFTRPSGASDDRMSVLQILVFFGLLGGIAGGMALALARSYAETRPRRAP
jgi:hypothetical protein